MLFRGVVTTMNSGKIDDVVYATNRGTAYVRSLGPPPTSFTAEQLAVQTAVQTAVSLWRGAVDAERAAWDRWARAQLRTNSVCQRAPRTGFNEYVRWAVPRIQAATQFELELSVTPEFAPEPAEEPTDRSWGIHFKDDNEITTDFSDTQAWTLDNNAVLLYYISAVIPPTRNRAYGGYNLMAAVKGTEAGPPLPSPITFGIPTVTSGDRVYFRIRLSTVIHGMSEPHFGRIVYP